MVSSSDHLRRGFAARLLTFPVGVRSGSGGGLGFAFSSTGSDASGGFVMLRACGGSECRGLERGETRRGDQLEHTATAARLLGRLVRVPIRATRRLQTGGLVLVVTQNTYIFSPSSFSTPFPASTPFFVGVLAAHALYLQNVST